MTILAPDMTMIRTWLTERYADVTDDERVVVLLDASVGRILIAEADAGRDAEIDPTDLRHIADWLTASVLANARWIDRVDENGHPIRLAMLRSIRHCLLEADDAMRVANAARDLSEFDPSRDERIYRQLPEGFTIVELLTPLALDMESHRMGHCIGDGAYDRHLRRSLFLSLRGPNGVPRATMHVVPFGGRHESRERPGTPSICWMLDQLKGKGNAPLARKHQVRLQPFIIAEGYRLVEGPLYTGLVQAMDDTLHPLNDLPEGLTVFGTLDLRGCDVSGLPKGMSVLGGDLDLRGCPITELPEDLHVEKNLYIQDLRIGRLPDRIRVDRAIHAAGTPVSAVGFEYDVNSFVTESTTDEAFRLGA